LDAALEVATGAAFPFDAGAVGAAAGLADLPLNGGITCMNMAGFLSDGSEAFTGLTVVAAIGFCPVDAWGGGETAFVTVLFAGASACRLGSDGKILAAATWAPRAAAAGEGAPMDLARSD